MVLTNTYEGGLKAYACTRKNCRGRLYGEVESTTRTPFQRDRDRIIHCSTFRRLKHKTQVFVFHEGDYYRTRLTHSIEVAQITRSICRALGLNEDLGEALALAHDFGHTAFGHAGGDALNAAMKPFGGFDHNAQSLRLVTTLERRYAAFPGLNLTWDTLEGLAKHNGPLAGAAIDVQNPPKTLPWAFREYLPLHDLEVHTFAAAEAQVAALSDDIAYNNHDIEDGLRAGLFKFSQLKDIKLIARVIEEVDKTTKDIPENIRIHEVVRRIINLMVVDLLTESEGRLGDLGPGHPDDIRGASAPVIAFSDAMVSEMGDLKDFLMANMYQHPKVSTMSENGKRVVTDLFNLYIEKPEKMPPEWGRQAAAPGARATARVAADFIAGMTDRYALGEHQKLFKS
ncbi:MAG: deoxyguanosinetriphosphate triphosphohydrolase [Alphaproteobacteria bacterium]|nr:MAG: deoxyguanosinetriphosphate triphosphohydrolase [Alphaproteobacteria bacterium]